MRKPDESPGPPRASAARRTLRLWPGLVLVVLQWLLRFVLPLLAPDLAIMGLFATLLSSLALTAWWVFFSRALSSERWGAVGMTVVALVVTFLLLHESMATGGQGFVFVVYVIPTLSLAFVAWAMVARKLEPGASRRVPLAALLVGCGGWTLVSPAASTAISIRTSPGAGP